MIGIVGGIGSGKSFVARLFGELGACVIHSDEVVHQIYQRPDVQQTLQEWWGPDVLTATGVDRRAVAKIIFDNEHERHRLEALVHPLVTAERERVMAAAAQDPKVTAFVWDTPLLIESNLHKSCDAVVFVDTPTDVRIARVADRGWDAAELARREILQTPLDKKRTISHYVIRNAADSGDVREQVRRVFSEILFK